ncbi:MAG: phosphatidylserine decarboxylase family protein [Pseudomonadota bacterium]
MKQFNDNNLDAYKRRPVQLPVAFEGFPFIGFVLLLALMFWYLSAIYLALPFFVLAISIALFFRNPPRRFPRGEMILLSPADGRVISAGENGDFNLVSIFMSVANVHINRMPCAGTVTDVAYNKGKFHIAHCDKASLDNEQNCIEFKDQMGRNYKMIQIAGYVARRIVCYFKGTENFKQGERAGLIRFGSRVDLYMPKEIVVTVKVGDKVRGGETIVGRM